MPDETSHSIHFTQTLDKLPRLDHERLKNITRPEIQVMRLLSSPHAKVIYLRGFGPGYTRMVKQN